MTAPYKLVGNFMQDIGIDPDWAFSELYQSIPWERRDDAPRSECWMNDFNRAYTYGSGRGIRTYEAHAWNPLAMKLRHAMTKHVPTYFPELKPEDYEGCFLNMYEGERDWLGWHADNDKKIDHAKHIAVITVGQERAIQVRTLDRTWKQEFMLTSGSLFLMPPGSQFTHEHQIPKVGRVVNPRISLTYRGLVL